MNDESTVALYIAAVFAVACSASYLFASEGVRGAGRVIGGLCFIALGLLFGYFMMPAQTAAGVMFGIGGVITVVCGARKFMRR